MAKILLVEDDEDIQFTVCKSLSNESYTVEVAASGEEALDRLQAFNYDVIVLDIALPGVSGMSVCESYRRSGGKAPIIMLTGKTAIEDKECGLDLGADDYLTKPFHMRELLARIRAVLRRPAQVAGNVLQARGMELNAATRTLKVDGQEIYLLPRDFELLEFFMRHPGQIFSSEALLERVWHNDKDVGQDALRSSIRRIRQKINDNDCVIIENVPKVGYRLTNA
jgi:DNA-binding response OmpR family regulator